MKRFIITGLVLLFTASTFSAYGWSGFGHTLVGFIADQHLSPEAQKQCDKYLKHTLSYYGSWLDQVRYLKGYEATKKMHASAVDARTGKYFDEGKGAALNVARLMKEMKNGGYRNMCDSTITDNIRTLIHMVGDMHCPSHVSYRNSAGMDLWQARKVKGKRKTRDYIIRGRRIRHHGFWDGSPSLFHRNWTCEQFVQEFDKLSKHRRAEICSGTPFEWVEENGVKSRISFLPHGTDFDQLPIRKQQQLIKLCDDQLVHAGHRLAYVLNTIFAD